MGKEADRINNDQYYEYLIDTYQNLIYSICFKIVGDYFEAQDLAQETFISAYKNLHSFDRQYEKAWLSRIATNKCLDYIKAASRRIVPTEETYFLQEENLEASPEENVLEDEVRKQLYKRCSNLKAPYKDIAIDYFYNELTAKEIAEKTDKKLKTVQSQIYRARAMLRKKYLEGGKENE